MCRGVVYGLLNRKCLLAWDAETGECIREMPLTQASPGSHEPAITFNFLTVRQRRFSKFAQLREFLFQVCENLVSTIHASPSCVSVSDASLNNVVVLDAGAALSAAAEAEASEGGSSSRSAAVSAARACDVLINDHCVLVRTVNFGSPGFDVVCYPRASIQGDKGTDGNSSNNSSHNSNPARVIKLLSVSDCVVHDLTVTPIKILNFARNKLMICDFL